MIRLGTAGWSIPKQHGPCFPDPGSHLERYARRLTATEINTSFYRPHRPATYARWAASTPPAFRFAVKMPREISHIHKLVGADAPLDRFLAEVPALGDRLGPLLLQLPPSLAYDEAQAATFLQTLRSRFDGGLVVEPRHPTWFTDAADAMLTRFRAARVAADPAPVPRAAVPGGWTGLTYRRLHGSPRTYHSAYDTAYLDTTAHALRHPFPLTPESWCIFDNTASGAAAGDALGLLRRLQSAFAGRAVHQPG